MRSELMEIGARCDFGRTRTELGKPDLAWLGTLIKHNAAPGFQAEVLSI